MKVNIKNFRDALNLGYDCYIYNGKDGIQINKVRFTGVKIDKNSIKEVFKQDTGIDCNKFNYYIPMEAEIVLKASKGI